MFAVVSWPASMNVATSSAISASVSGEPSGARAARSTSSRSPGAAAPGPETGSADGPDRAAARRRETIRPTGPSTPSEVWPTRRATAFSARVDAGPHRSGRNEAATATRWPASIARAIMSVSPLRSEPNSARPTMSSASALICPDTLISEPSASGSQRAIIRRADSVITGPKLVTCRRENTGWTSRRCCRQRSPSLVSRPSPIRARNGR